MTAEGRGWFKLEQLQSRGSVGGKGSCKLPQATILIWFADVLNSRVMPKYKIFVIFQFL